MHRDLDALLARTGGVAHRGHHAPLRHQIDRAARRGILRRLLPNTYLHADLFTDWRARIRAVTLWNPDAVICGQAAAASTFWPDRVPRVIEVACDQVRFTSDGFAFTTRTIPAELVAPSRITVPALTALDLAPSSNGNSIDDVLRRRMATLAGLQRALELLPGRRGNSSRRRLLLDSRAEPWSSGERLAHRHLRRAGITQWRANVPIVCDGRTFYQDIAMTDCPVVVEVDGRIHLRPEVFEADRDRGNLLLLAGKQVLHVTTTMLERDPAHVVSIVRRARAMYL